MSLHNKIMNLPCVPSPNAPVWANFAGAYKEGHRDARHAAAELAAAEDAAMAALVAERDALLALVREAIGPLELEAAAKAAGIEGRYLEYITPSMRGIGEVFSARLWNPREDDGAAFRLAVRRGMYVNIEGMEIGYRFGGVLCIEPIVLTDRGLEDATRLAIVRAAAASTGAQA
jgi:hypothetical protein